MGEDGALVRLGRDEQPRQDADRGEGEQEAGVLDDADVQLHVLHLQEE